MEGQATHSATDDNTVAARSLPPPPGRANHHMYIVQFPKDQVYRVPPRENALFMEQFREKKRKPTTRVGRRRCCCGCCFSPRFWLTFALIVVSIVAIVGISLAVLFIIFNPIGPTFTVSDVVVKNGTKKPEYEVLLGDKNPNQRLGIEYVYGQVSLLFGVTEVAKGNFPTLKQDRDNSMQVKIELTGSNRSLPKGMNGGGKSKTPVALKLEMKLGLKMMAAGLKTWAMKAIVLCTFKVSGLGNNTQVLSQECHTNFNQY